MNVRRENKWKKDMRVRKGKEKQTDQDRELTKTQQCTGAVKAEM